MKKTMVRIISLCLAFAMTFVVFPVTANAWTFDKVSGTFATYRTGANAASSSYKSGPFYEKYLKVPLTGDQRTDTLAIALSQVGYQESPTSGDYDGVGGGSGNYTEFNYNMGDFGSGYAYSWCAAFVAWSLYQSGASDQNGSSDWCRNNTSDLDYIWCEVSCTEWANQLRRAGYLELSKQHGGSYIPQAGDLIFFSWSGSATSLSHIGLVVNCDGTTVWTVEGNTSSAEGLEAEGGGVYFKSYSLSYQYISGYGKLPYKTDESVKTIDYSGNNPTTGIYMATSGNKSVYQELESSSYSYTLPKFSMFEVLDVDTKSNGEVRLYSKCEINDSVVYGWISNGAAGNSGGYTRVVQIYANPDPTPIPDEDWEFDKVSGNFATYRTASNPASDSYMSGPFYDKFSKIPLTGDKRTDTVAIALSQVGYHDSATTNDFDGVGGGTGNYAEYNYNMGDYGSGYSYSWPVTFVWWSLYQSRATDQYGQDDWCRNNTDDLDYIWCEVSCTQWANQLRNAGYLEVSEYHGGTYIPQAGDLIFFSLTSSATTMNHIGIVVDCDGETVWTVEGNTTTADGVVTGGEGVYFKSYALDSEYISGFGKLPYEEKASVAPVDYSGEKPTTGIYMAACGTKAVYTKINDSESAYTLPKFAMFEVLDIGTHENGATMLYSKCKIDGEIVYGWIAHGTAKNQYMQVVQIYANPAAISSEIYEITSENLIKGVSVGTSVDTFVSNLEGGENVQIFKGETLLTETDNIGTGFIAKVMDGETEVARYTLVVKGDVNGDTRINGVDYALIKRHVLGVNELQGVYFQAGSIFKPNMVLAYDYVMVKRHVLGHIKL